MSRPSVRVLLAEDEEHLGTILETFLRGRGQRVTRVRDGRAALDALRTQSFDVALLDIIMPELDGLEVLRALGTLPAPPEAIVMTGNGTVDTAITAIQLGAYDYLAKPYRMAEVDLLISRAAEKRALRLAASTRRWPAADVGAAFVTRTPELRGALAVAEREVRGPAAARPWIISGPPGSGRRTLAGWLHARSPLAHQPALLVGASGDAAVDAVSLFGDAGGSGDGALGALEAAGRGMVVVDGWSRLAPSIRESLHRAAVDGQVGRGGAAGGPADVPVDARLCLCVDDVATLPAALVAAALVVHLPPLRERPADVRALAEHFLRLAGRDDVALHADASEALGRHDWPGQVAELRDVISAAAWRITGGTMDAAHLALPVPVSGSAGRGGGSAAAEHAGTSLAELERRQIAAVLEEVGWHRGRAAARLGISVRTLYRRVRQLGLSPAGSAGSLDQAPSRARRSDGAAPARGRGTGMNVDSR